MIYGLAIMIEGLGDRNLSPPDDEYRYIFCDNAANDMDVDQSFEHALLEFPSEIAVSTNFVNGTSTIGGQTFVLDGLRPSITQKLYRTRHDKISNLSVGISATATSITLINDDGTADTTRELANIILGREAIWLEQHNGAGVYDCVRGVFSTLATAHGAELSDDTEIYDAEQGPLLIDRAIILVRYDLKDWENRTVLWRGVINEIQAPDPTRIAIIADSAMSLLMKRNICTKLFRGEIKLQFGTGAISVNVDQDTTPMVAQNATPGTGDNFLMSVANEAGLVASWFNFVADKYTITGHRQNLLTDSAPMPEDVRGEFWEFLSTSPEAPDLDQAGNRFGHMSGTTNPSAITAILQVLTTTVGGNNGIYDLGGDRPMLGQTMGAGILEDLIDIAAIELVREQLGADDVQRSLLLAFDGEPVNVHSWISSILRGFGAVLTTGNEGKITIVRLLDWPSANGPVVTEQDFIGDIRQRRGLRAAVDSLTIEYHDRPGLGPITVTYRDALHSQKQIASSRTERTLPLHGVVSRIDAGRIASAYLERYRVAIPELECNLLRDKDYWPGQIITLSHPMIYDTDGTRGVVDGIYLVTGRKDVLDLSSIWYELKRMDLGRIGLIGPSGKVLSYSNGGGGGPYVVTWDQTTGVDLGEGSFDAFDDLQLLNADMSVSDAGPITILSTTATTATLSFDISASAGEWMWLSNYDNATVKDEWAWIADSNDELGINADEAYIWVTI